MRASSFAFFAAASSSAAFAMPRPRALSWRPLVRAEVVLGPRVPSRDFAFCRPKIAARDGRRGGPAQCAGGTPDLRDRPRLRPPCQRRPARSRRRGPGRHQAAARSEHRRAAEPDSGGFLGEPRTTARRRTVLVDPLCSWRTRVAVPAGALDLRELAAASPCARRTRFSQRSRHPRSRGSRGLSPREAMLVIDSCTTARSSATWRAQVALSDVILTE